MDGWHVALISVAIPALITAGLPYLSSYAKRRQARRMSDAEFGIELRDRLWARVDALETENRELRDSLAAAHRRITRLEWALRKHGHADELEDMA